jgi:hypothetical protein
LTKYVLARLQVRKEERALVLFVQRLSDDQYEPVHLASSSSPSSSSASMELVRRRRHSFDELKEAKNGVDKAAEELKNARLQAEKLSNITRISVEAFSKNSRTEAVLSRRKSELSGHWGRVMDKMALRNAVDHTREHLESLQTQK